MRCDQSLALLCGVVFTFLQLVAAKRDKTLYCGACIAMVEEMNWQIAGTDPKKKVQVGSYRLDSHGKQKLNEIPLAKSETHLTELMEVVCNEMANYAKSWDDGTQTMNYIRTSSRDGTPISLKHVEVDSEGSRLLKYICDTILEEHEEELLPIFQKPEKERSKEVCVEHLAHCKEGNLTRYAELTAESFSLGKQEQEEQKLKDEERRRKEAERGDEDSNSDDEDEEDREDTRSQAEKDRVKKMADDVVAKIKAGAGQDGPIVLNPREDL